MTRIIAGKARGRRLAVPATGTRPTSDRVREALFASVESRLGGRGASWTEVSVCDLWSGSGALALEAWSRGAGRVLAVDRSPKAVGVIEANIAELNAEGVRVQRSDVTRALAQPPAGGAFDVVFADPPYEDDDQMVRSTLASGLAHGWFTSNALLVVERRARASGPPVLPDGISTLDERTYGDTVLWYGLVTDEREENPQ